MEEWKVIVDYPNYEVSSLGRIKAIRGSRFTYVDNRGRYSSVTLKQEGKRRILNTHRIVAIAFIPNPLNLPMVNHKDGNRYNNQADNLEWVTASQNMKHAYLTGLCPKPPKYTGRHVIQFSLEGVELQEFINVEAAANTVKGIGSNISKCCRGKRNKHAGYRWAYKN